MLSMYYYNLYAISTKYPRHFDLRISDKIYVDIYVIGGRGSRVMFLTSQNAA